MSQFKLKVIFKNLTFGCQVVSLVTPLHFTLKYCLIKNKIHEKGKKTDYKKYYKKIFMGFDIFKYFFN